MVASDQKNHTPYFPTYGDGLPPPITNFPSIMDGWPGWGRMIYQAVPASGMTITAWIRFFGLLFGCCRCRISHETLWRASQPLHSSMVAMVVDKPWLIRPSVVQGEKTSLDHCRQVAIAHTAIRDDAILRSERWGHCFLANSPLVAWKIQHL